MFVVHYVCARVCTVSLYGRVPACSEYRGREVCVCVCVWKGGEGAYTVSSVVLWTQGTQDPPSLAPHGEGRPRGSEGGNSCRTASAVVQYPKRRKLHLIQELAVIDWRCVSLFITGQTDRPDNSAHCPRASHKGHSVSLFSSFWLRSIKERVSAWDLPVTAGSDHAQLGEISSWRKNHKTTLSFICRHWFCQRVGH